MSTTAHQSELSRCVDITRVTGDGIRLVFEATTSECDALNTRFGLQALHSLLVDARLLKEKKGDGEWVIRVSASYTCELEQICVISLEPFKVKLCDNFEVLFLLPSDRKVSEATVLDDVGEDIYESIYSSELDVGELVAQYLALSIDPYPKRPGASLVSKPTAISEENLDERSNNPFAILGQLRDKM